MTNRAFQTISLALVAALLSGCAAPKAALRQAEPFKPFAGPKPIAVLIQTDPWLMVIGSDTPRVALYEDGQVIYLKKQKGQPPVYLHKQLSPRQLADVKQKIASFGDLAGIKRYYDLAPNVTDQPESEFYLNLDGNIVKTVVYGLATSESDQPADTTTKGGESADKLPQPIADLHKYLTHLHFDDAQPWTPRYVEVMIWPYEYAPEESIAWLKRWPGLHSRYTTQRGDSYSIFLPGSELPRLLLFLKTQNEKGAVEIEGRKWAITYRFTFPSEPTWFNAFKPEEPTTTTAPSS